MSQIVLQSPQQASYTFDLSGPRAPRMKNLFCVRFVRGGANSSSWLNDLPFLAKSVDRPHVTPTVEELNQYNKRRQIQTGYKIQPLRMALYDTVDSLVMRMWAEYSKYYFGDFHQSSESNFKWDVTANKFLDDGNGFGFSPQTDFFFEKIEVYQVFGNKFVQFDIINPKISAFEPDDLDYANNEIGMINITFAYEAVNYINDNIPQDISNNQNLSAMFSDLRLKGNVIEPVDPSSVVANIQNTVGGSGAIPLQDASTNYFIPQSAQPSLRSYNSSTSTGELSSFGSFNFGTTGGSNNAPKSYSTDVAFAAASDPTLAATLNINNSKISSTQSQAGILGNQYDIANSAVQSITPTDHLENSLTQSVLGASMLSSQTPSQQVSNNNGLALSGDAYGLYNSQRSPTAQIGFNFRKA